jgi:formylglycine-generating enzyme required for sulfatase activity
MEHDLGDYKLIKKICDDHHKDSYLAEHKVLKTPYIVQIIKDETIQDTAACLEPCGNLVLLHEQILEGSTCFSVSGLDSSFEITSLKDHLFSQKEPLDESKILSLLEQMAHLLNHYYLSKRPKSFGLDIDNCFLDAQGKLVIIDHALPFGGYFNRSQNQKDTIEDHTLVAFGKIAYFLMTKEWPEGYFPLPSELNVKLDKKWDDFMKGCLHHNPKMRTSSFFDILLILERLKNQPVTLKPSLKPAQLERPEFEPNPGQIFQQELIVAKYLPQEKIPHNIEPIMSEMIVIPSGEYARGSLTGARDEMPRHKIQISPFALDTHPVTNEQFVRFLDVMGGEKDAQNNDMIRLKESRIKKLGGKLVIESGYSKHPVVGISWYGASAYAKWVGKRLPTEAEWEIAASSLKEDLYPTGETIEKSMANFFSSDTCPVMSYAPSLIGLYDMAGNVYEWCQDWYGYNYYEASIQEPLNPAGPQQGVYRVLRGGCWKSLKEDLRVSHRHRNNPFAVNSTYGFRCAADVE